MGEVPNKARVITAILKAFTNTEPKNSIKRCIISFRLITSTRPNISVTRISQFFRTKSIFHSSSLPFLYGFRFSSHAKHKHDIIYINILITNPNYSILSHQTPTNNTSTYARTHIHLIQNLESPQKIQPSIRIVCTAKRRQQESKTSYQKWFLNSHSPQIHHISKNRIIAYLCQ